MKKMLFLLILFVALFYSNSLDVSAQITPTESYKLLYENQKDYNAKILSTIYWALGGMVTVIVLFIGSNIFFNTKAKKDEIEILTNEFQTKLLEITNDVRKENENKLTSFSDNIKKDIDNDIKQLKSTVNEDYKRYQADNLLKIDELNHRFNNVTNGLKESISSNVGIFNSKIESISISNQKEFDAVKYEMYEIQAKYWSLANIPANAVRYYVMAALIRIKLKRSLDFPFEWIIEELKKCDSLNPKDKKLIYELLEETDPSYNATKEQIQELIKKIE